MFLNSDSGLAPVSTSVTRSCASCSRRPKKNVGVAVTPRTSASDRSQSTTVRLGSPVLHDSVQSQVHTDVARCDAQLWLTQLDRLPE